MNVDLIKRSLQLVSSTAIRLHLVQFLRTTEKVSAYLIGKGAASNYENSGEIEVLRSVLPPNPVVFDVAQTMVNGRSVCPQD